MNTVKFTKMEEGTAQEYALLDQLEGEYKAQLVPRLIEALERLDESLSGYLVSRLEHSLQAATRAFRDGRSDQWVAAALLHDVGDVLAPYSHSEMAAAILRPFVEEEIYWVVKHHGVFQMYYYAHYSGGDRHAREVFKDHPFYQSAIDFCHHYDQNCFDPEYSHEPLEFFRPILVKVFQKPRSFDQEQQARYGKT